MTWALREAHSAIFGALVADEAVDTLDADGFAIVTNTVHSLDIQYLITHVALGIGVAH